MKKGQVFIFPFAMILLLVFPFQAFSSFSQRQETSSMEDQQGDNIEILMDEHFGTPWLITPEKAHTWIPLPDKGLSLSAKAFAFLGEYKSLLKIQEPYQEYRVYKIFESKDGTRMKHIKLHQVKNDIDVFGAEWIIHFNQQDEIVSVNGTRVSEIFDSHVPMISEDQARSIVQSEEDGAPPQDRVDSSFTNESKLFYFPRRFIQKDNPETILIWRVKTDQAIYFIDADTGGVLHKTPRNKAARDRRVYTSNGTTRLPGKQLMNESGYLYPPQQIPEPARTDSKESYDYLGQTYDYYFRTFNRDSFDGRGSVLLSSVNFYTRSLCPNAFWDPDRQQMIYCDHMTEANDITAHEWTHGVSNSSVGNEEGFLGWGEYGALGESYSDFFGAMVDRTDWIIGEDVLDIQPYFRNMANPMQSNPWQPDHMKFEFEVKPPCNDGNDDCWIHINNGIPNKAAYLLGELGTRSHYGITVKGIGRTKTEQIYYKTLNEKLNPGSDFFAAYRYSVLSCEELIGQYGITSLDCQQVDNAFRAVGMNPLVQELVGTYGDCFGNTVSMGDFNHDGYDDIITGLPCNSDGGLNAGKVNFYYGSARMDSIVDKQIVSNQVEEGFGFNVDFIGDVNGDGIDDFAVANWGAWYGDPGRVYIYYGGQPLNIQADVILDSPRSGDRYGGYSSFRAGDVNGDGYDDVIVGADMDWLIPEPSKAYLYFGGSAMNNQVDVEFTSEGIYDFFGTAVDGAGDMNRDGYDDLIIGAWADSSQPSKEGKVYVYYGGSIMNAEPDLEIYGGPTDYGFGGSLSRAGDANGDGYDDMTVADFNDHVYLFFGGALMDDEPDVALQPPAEDVSQDFGHIVNEVNDVNHDGYDDIVVTNPDADGLRDDFPKAYVYYGGRSMDVIADHIFIGEHRSEGFGYDAGGGGDVNRDGFSDVFVGGNENVNSSKGGIYIYSIF